MDSQIKYYSDDSYLRMPPEIKLTEKEQKVFDLFIELNLTERINFKRFLTQNNYFIL